jgi:hypothetical protein
MLPALPFVLLPVRPFGMLPLLPVMPPLLPADEPDVLVLLPVRVVVISRI